MVFDSVSDSSSSGDTWISWYCSQDDNKFLVEIDEDFVADYFNYHGLYTHFQNFDNVISVMRGRPPTSADYNDPVKRTICKQAKGLYALLHSRYIISPKGLNSMRQKYLECCFGYCPRVLCNSERLLPVGLSDDLGERRARVYCQKCQEAYSINESSRAIDGANFGCSFPHIFIQTFHELLTLKIPSPFVPKIFGFRIHNLKSLIQIKLERGEYGDLNHHSIGAISNSEDGQQQSINESIGSDES